MKARVKATGKVIEVINVMNEDGKGIWEDMSVISTNPARYHNYELDFIDLPKDLQHNEPDYWTKLHHQAAIAAMQGILSNTKLMDILGMQKGRELDEMVADLSLKHATALVNKLKEDKQ